MNAQFLKRTFGIFACATALCLLTTFSFVSDALAIPVTVHQGQGCFAFAGSDFVAGDISISGNNVTCTANNIPPNGNIQATTDKCKMQLSNGQVLPLGNAQGDLEDLGFIQCSYVIPLMPTSAITPSSQTTSVAG